MQYQNKQAVPLFYPYRRLLSTCGFTLMELLVVVLIIGILAAVALPQYQKAVRKTRIAEAKVLLKQLTDAQDVYFLTNPGTTSVDFNDLDIGIPQNTQNWTLQIDDCIQDGPITGCLNYAFPTFETATYKIGFSSKNYGPGTWDFTTHFICVQADYEHREDGIKRCTDLGGVLSEDDDLYYILP